MLGLGPDFEHLLRFWIVGNKRILVMRLKALVPKSLYAMLHLARARLLSAGLPSTGSFVSSSEEQHAASQISLIVPVHNAPAVTLRCLNSLEKFAHAAEIVVVDDGSDLEGMGGMLGEICAMNGWRLIRHERALGHSRASEAGVGASSKPYLCLLNSDTVVTPRSWSAIVEAFESDQAIGVVGPATSFTFGPQQVFRACCCRHYWADEQLWAFAEKYTARYRKERLMDATFAGGFAFFVRRTVWVDLNGFDLNLPDYGNEAEFCRRVLARGLRIVTTRASYIHHLGRQSYGGTIGRPEVRKRSMTAQTYIEAKYGKILRG